jgi:hypothetical protein
VSEALLTLLRWCLLALVYLFFFRVLQATWSSTVAGRQPDARQKPSEGKRRRRMRVAETRHSGTEPTLRIVEPASAADQRFEVTSTLSLGRAAGCEITLDDTFVSQLHARVTRTPSGVVVEDLGSTNGTYLNRKRVTAPVVMQSGDVVQVGSTVLELQ